MDCVNYTISPHLLPSTDLHLLRALGNVISAKFSLASISKHEFSTWYKHVVRRMSVCTHKKCGHTSDPPEFVSSLPKCTQATGTLGKQTNNQKNPAKLEHLPLCFSLCHHQIVTKLRHTKGGPHLSEAQCHCTERWLHRLQSFHISSCGW